jgi:hypothetical protein
MRLSRFIFRLFGSFHLRYIRKERGVTTVMFWSIGPFAVIIPFIMIFIAVRAIRGLTSYRHHQQMDDRSSDYESIAVDVKRLSRETGRRFRTDSLESKIFRLALEQKGVLTVSDVVIETGLSIADAETVLEDMVDGTHVKMELTPDGMVRYEFPEIMGRLSDEDGQE